MHEYDTVLKALLQSPQNTIFERITGDRIDRWLNVEFPEVQQTRVDLLGETADKRRIIGVKLQSANDAKLPMRMAEYALRTYRLYGRFPEQYVLYVGNAKLRMPSKLDGPAFHCHYKIIDIRRFKEEELLASPFDADNILAILARHRDRRETIRRILERIGKLEGEARDTSLKKLLILAGLRKLGNAIRTEVKQMPILDDIMDHDLIGPAIRKGIKQGLKQGVEQGIRQGVEQGIQRGELAILRGMIDKRFGSLPAWVDERLTKLSTAELEELSLRFIDAKSVDELFSS